MDLSKQLFGDLATGFSAITAFNTPGVSAALINSLGNLIVGKSVESFNTQYYFDKTFQALESAITAQRLDVSRKIIAKQAKAKSKTDPVSYGVVQALSNIRAYDDACSIKAGLARLVQLADQEKAVSVQKTNKAEIDPKSVIEELSGIAASQSGAPDTAANPVSPITLTPATLKK